MSAPAAPEPTVFRTQRRLPYPPEVVYAAFADARQLAQWWGPRDFTNTFDTFEFRPGGEWVFVMHGADGGHYPNASVFRTLEAPNLVVIEHVSPPHFTLTVTLAPDPAGTLLTWAQAFPEPRVAAQLQTIVEPANEENLDRLTAVLAAPPDA